MEQQVRFFPKSFCTGRREHWGAEFLGGCSPFNSFSNVENDGWAIDRSGRTVGWLWRVKLGAEVLSKWRTLCWRSTVEDLPLLRDGLIDLMDRGLSARIGVASASSIW